MHEDITDDRSSNWTPNERTNGADDSNLFFVKALNDRYGAIPSSEKNPLGYSGTQQG